MYFKKTFSFLLVILVLLINTAYAAKVDISTAKKTGLNFFRERSQNVPVEQLRVEESFTITFNGNPVYYIFNFQAEGFVVVSADDAVTPVLAYSYDGKYSQENQPPQFVDWMDGYARQIDYSVQHNLAPVPSVSAEWMHLLTNDPTQLTPMKSTLDVAPLLLSTWDQGSPYNELCPEDQAGPGGRVWAGCVATAMCQVMYYYRWPETGVGSHCYYPSGYPQQCADYGNTTYNWYGMLNSVQTQNIPVATLLWHAGISVDMMYSPSGSGAYSDDAVTAMINNFKYHSNTTLLYKDNYSEDAWANILKDNLNQKRPMYYHGFGSGGHAFNVDGYQGTNYFHFNWGWSGSYNGYYYLTNLNPGGSNFTNGQGAIVNLYPDTNLYNYPAYCSGQVVLTTMKGTFEDGSGPVIDYQNNADCGWLISPESTSDSIDYITITFNRFSVEPGDMVNIYQGSSTTDSLIASLSGDNLPPAVVVNSSKARITFSSNSTGTRSGWYASYVAHSMVWCNGTTTITDDQGTVSDGSLYFNYKDKSVCRWKILPDNNGPVTFTFTSLNTEPGNDVVKIYDYGTEQLLGEFSGNYSSAGLPGPVTAASGKMFIMFTTNNTVNDQGWEGNFSTYPVGTNDLQYLSNVQIYPNPAKDLLRISLFSDKKQLLRTEILSLEGKSLLDESTHLVTGMNQLQVTVSGISTGVYILRLTSDQESVTRKVVIE